MTAQTVLFLCPHNAAKSVIAAALFNRLAAQSRLPYWAESAGTEPDPAVSPKAAALLAAEGIDVSGHIPRQVTADDLGRAACIISLGCTPEALGVPAETLDTWNQVPMISQEPERAYAAIQALVRQLVDELRAEA